MKKQVQIHVNTFNKNNVTGNSIVNSYCCCLLCALQGKNRKKNTYKNTFERNWNLEVEFF